MLYLVQDEPHGAGPTRPNHRRSSALNSAQLAGDAGAKDSPFVLGQNPPSSWRPCIGREGARDGLDSVEEAGPRGHTGHGSETDMDGSDKLARTQEAASAGPFAPEKSPFRLGDLNELNPGLARGPKVLIFGVSLASWIRDPMSLEIHPTWPPAPQRFPTTKLSAPMDNPAKPPAPVQNGSKPTLY